MRKRILSFCLLFSLLFGNNIVNANWFDDGYFIEERGL